MTLVIDANMRMFADRMNISSSRMIRDYGLSSVDEIIESEAKKGNVQALNYAKEYYHSTAKLIELFRLNSVENRFAIIHKMDSHTRDKLLPLLEQEDLVMGLNFFKQDKLLEMLLNVGIDELVRVILEAFPIEAIVAMFTEEDLAMFFMNRDLGRADTMEQLRMLPHDVMQKFIEGVTGQPSDEVDGTALINSLDNLSDDDFRKFMASIDPDVQRQLTFQLTTDKPEYLMLFPNETYVNMLSKLMKPDMVAPLVKLDKESLVNMNLLLPPDLMSIVGAQIDSEELAKYLQHYNMNIIEEALMI